jgi:hypothetical protein
MKREHGRRRKIKLIEGNAKCRHPKNLPVRRLCGRVRRGSEGCGVAQLECGVAQTVARRLAVRGATVHKAGSYEYQHD